MKVAIEKREACRIPPVRKGSEPGKQFVTHKTSETILKSPTLESAIWEASDLALIKTEDNTWSLVLTGGVQGFDHFTCIFFFFLRNGYFLLLIYLICYLDTMLDDPDNSS